MASTPPLMDAVAEHLGLPPIQVYEIATFYPRSRPSPWAAHPFRYARTFPACCAAPRRWWTELEEAGIKTGESTPDGRIDPKREEECLAACTGAPMMMVDHVYYEHLTPESIDRILDDLK